MSWRAYGRCSSSSPHRFTVARRSLAPSLRRSVSSGYVGRCRSRPLPSPHCRRRRRWDRSLTHSLARCRFMQRECAMIKPPSIHRRHDPSNSLLVRVCVQLHYRKPIRKLWRWRRRSGGGLGSPLTRDSGGCGQIVGRTGWDGIAQRFPEMGLAQNSRDSGRYFVSSPSERLASTAGESAGYDD